jgi:hypothetical protein
MARISTYGIDGVPELGDKVIGTDSAVAANLATKNYSLGEVVALFNKKNSIGVADQTIYLFQDDIQDGRESGTVSFGGGGGIGTPFSSVTTFLMSKSAAGGQSRAQYTPLFVGKDIILAELGNINNFGSYKVVSIETNVIETDFFDVTVENYYSNGSFSKDAHYIFSEFVNPSSDEGDKNFVFTQAVPSETWTIQHDLDKFPSVSVVNNNNILMYGNTTYTDKNNLTINFSAGFSGKAYLN